jgi:dTDP-4-dehydrorhamnose 3,5-epimerase
MIEGIKIKNLRKNIDERGWLIEAYRRDETDYSPAMAYISFTKHEVIRGPHEHVRQSDCFVFTGPGNFELHLWDRRPDSPTLSEHMELTVGADNPALVIVPPGVVHGYKCVSPEGGLSINFPDQLYKGEGKNEEVDEIRWESDPDSPYKIL